jgi:glycosyltransferase involved in cell wall biosynthesis
LRPDLVHVRGLGNEGFHAALAARLSGCRRVLVSIHGSVRDLQRPAHPLRARVVSRILEPLTLLLASDIVTICGAMSRRRFLTGFRSKLRAVVPNGVPLSDPTALAAARGMERAALAIPADAVVALVVGRLSVEKGHLVLAEALRRHPVPVTVLVVGDGPDRAEIKDAYAQCGVQVCYTGHVDDVTPVLAAADLFVLPSLHENLSNALLEGMAAGLPVVATAVGGTVEVVSRGGGLLVPPADPDALGDALARLIANPQERRVLGEQARTTIAAHYTVEHMAERWAELYRSVGLTSCVALNAGRDSAQRDLLSPRFVEGVTAVEDGSSCG